MAYLKVISAEGERTVFLSADPVVLGRGQEADVLIKDIKISRRHCVVEPCGGGKWAVRDLDSGNGIRVNGEEVAGRVLKPDDVVQLGDTRIVFAGELAQVVNPGPEPAAPAAPETGRGMLRASTSRTARHAARSNAWIPWAAGAACVVVWALVALKGGTPESREDTASKQAAAAAARAAATVADEPAYTGYQPGPAERAVLAETKDLGNLEAIERLRKGIEELPADSQSAVREELVRREDALRDEREARFGELEKIFHAHVQKGEYFQAREIWFFLRGDWGEIPDLFRDRILSAYEELETSASVARSRLLEEVTRLESESDLGNARELLVLALPRFDGTAVARSLRERLDVMTRFKRGPGPSRAPAATIKVSLLQQVNNLLELCETREFSKAARGLQDLAATVKRDRAKAVVLRRAGECAAAALVFDRVVKDLAAGKAPGGQIAADDSRWRVLGGDASSLRVRTRGQERTFAWKDVPAGLFIALLERGSEGVPHGALGVAVAALGTGRQDLVLTSLQTGYEDSQARALLDAFVAGRVRKEALPEGGYLVASGELLTRKEHFRRQEEATIAKYRLQLEKAHAAIKSSKAAKRMAALRKRKDKLDKLRAYALELIYDTKKYFYPYRARMAEYIPVQREVDARVDAVREVWDDSYSVTIKLTPELKRALEQFDQAAKELTRRIVDVEEAVEDVAFRRAYLGQKFNVRNFFRTPVERELLAYSREVMEDDAKAEGDIKGVEREQVRVTNEYRIMFGRWPVRIVEPLVLSSRGHCEEMSKLGYFGHFSPTPGRRTPYERMALQGYKYGASENCVGGTSDPTSAHVRWCHSSGHHRNLLMAEWTEMGTGAYSSLMTQNFGRAPRHSKLWPKESAGGAGAGSDSYDDDAEGFDYDDDGEDDMEEEDEDADLEDEDEESVLEEGEG